MGKSRDHKTQTFKVNNPPLDEPVSVFDESYTDPYQDVPKFLNWLDREIKTDSFPIHYIMKNIVHAETKEILDKQSARFLLGLLYVKYLADTKLTTLKDEEENIN